MAGEWPDNDIQVHCGKLLTNHQRFQYHICLSLVGTFYHFGMTKGPVGDIIVHMSFPIGGVSFFPCLMHDDRPIKWSTFRERVQ